MFAPTDRQVTTPPGPALRISRIKMQLLNRAVLEVLAVFAAAVGFSIYFTYPLAFHFGNHLAELGDSRLTTYIHTWVTHTLTTHPLQLFDMNMFYPARNTLAGTENLLGNQILFAPVYLLTGNPIAAQNFVTLAALFLSAITLYWLLRSVSLPSWAAAVGGLVYGFALPKLAQLGHMQLLSSQWIPLAVLFLYRYLLNKRVLDLAGMTAALVLQVLCSLYLGYIALLVWGCCFAAVLCLRRDLVTWQAMRNLALAGIAAALVISPVALPYLNLQHHNVIPKENPATLLASADPVASYFDVWGLPHHIYGQLLRRFHSANLDWEKRLFVGFAPLLLAMLGTLSLRSVRSDYEAATHFADQRPTGQLRGIQKSLVLGAIFTAVIAYLLSLGPVLHIHDQPTSMRLPFYYLERWVPGLGVFRVPARFVLAFIFGIAVLAGFGIFTLLKRLRGSWVKAVCSAGVIAFITLEYSIVPMSIAPVMTPSRVAPEYRWLAARPAGSVVVELPITGPATSPDPYEQAGYVYASAYHWQPLINGYTGYRPPVTWETYQLAQNLPAATSVDLLGGIGLKYVVIHENKMSASDIRRWQSQPRGLHLAAKFDNGAAIFEVADARCRANISAIRDGHESLQQASQCSTSAAVK